MIPNLKFETNLYSEGYKLICGVDEVGKGAWAGPLVVCAVILRTDKRPYKIRDSKVINEKNRESLFNSILNLVMDYSIGEVSSTEIDRLGLSKAQKLAGKRCIDNLKLRPDYILLDGSWNFLEEQEKIKKIIKGDTKSLSIASASIIAKVTRDRLLSIYHTKYPDYNFKCNKGYGTKEHQSAIKKHGLLDIHRKSYKISVA